MNPLRYSLSRVVSVCAIASLGGLLFPPQLLSKELPLVDAVEAKDFQLAKALIPETADLNAAQTDGMTALHWATYHDDWDTAKLLLDRGANPTVRNRYAIEPIYLAAMNGNADLIRGLLQAGADANAKVNGNETALMTAARTGKADAVRVLIEAGADVDAKERRGQTAIMWAANEGHVDVVKLLLDANADFLTPLKNSGYTPFYFAIREGEAEVVRLLLDAGADINGEMRMDKSRGKLPLNGTSPLLLAIENGHFDLAVEFLDRGADPNDTRTGYTPLHTLTWIRKPDLGESARGDPAPRGSGRRNSEQFIRDLVARGADVNAQLKRGGKSGISWIGATPFFFAADRADIDYMKLLVELGADPFIPNEQGTTPFMMAAGIGSHAPEEEAGNIDECLVAVKYLISLGAKVNTVNIQGETAMHGAAYKNAPNVAAYLHEQGADIQLWNTKNKRGWTPLLIAEGYRPGNFKPSFETVDAITEIMLVQGVKPPDGPRPKPTNYSQ